MGQGTDAEQRYPRLAGLIAPAIPGRGRGREAGRALDASALALPQGIPRVGELPSAVTTGRQLPGLTARRAVQLQVLQERE